MGISRYIEEDNYYLEVAIGNIPWTRTVHKFGRMPNMDISTEYAVTPSGTLYLPIAPSTVRVKAGGNAADTVDGAGARILELIGLDQNGLRAVDYITTNGALASLPTTVTFSRLFRVRVFECGTYTTNPVLSNNNVGNIQIETVTSPTDWVLIRAGAGQSEEAAYTVPMDEDAYLMDILISVDGTKSCDFFMHVRDNYLNTTTNIAPTRTILYLDGIDQSVNINHTLPKRFAAGTDMWFTAIAAANNTESSVEFNIVLQKTQTGN